MTLPNEPAISATCSATLRLGTRPRSTSDPLSSVNSRSDLGNSRFISFWRRPLSKLTSTSITSGTSWLSQTVTCVCPGFFPVTRMSVGLRGFTSATSGWATLTLV